MIKHKPTPPLKRKPLDLPSEVAQRFVRYILHGEPNPLRGDEIAGHTMRRMLNEHDTGKLRTPDVKRMFAQLRDELG
jgi:hypothetical protein